MARTYGSKDLKPRKRRTREEVKEIKTQNEQERIKEELMKEFYLVPKELLDLSGVSYGFLINVLKKTMIERVNEVCKKYE